MKNHWRIGVVFVLAVLGDGAALFAQDSGRFNRVTTPGVRRIAAPSPSRLTNVARTGRTAAVLRNSSEADSLRPYSTEALARMEASASRTPMSSTWRQESQPVVSLPVVQESRPRSYFPGMRPGLAVQQPVTLTARATFVPHICTPSRSQMMGGGHHR
jgi:hypothetical protein